MPRIAECASIGLMFGYLLGSPSATSLRPVVIEEPFVRWHHVVNTAAVLAGAAAKQSGMAIGVTLKQSILSGTFLGRVGA